MKCYKVPNKIVRRQGQILIGKGGDAEIKLYLD